jgi:hypothetical protein
MECAFCSRNDEHVEAMIAGPEGCSICDQCLMKVSEGILQNESDLFEKVMCSFCCMPDRKPHGIGIGGNVTICSQCTLTAFQVLRKHGE